MPFQPSQAGVVGLPEGWAILTDPPYGLGERMTGGNGEWAKGWGTAPDWDKQTADGVVQIASAFSSAIVWGGNYFTDFLPPTMQWLVWDKGQRINQSDGELAYTSLEGALRIRTLNRVELMKDGAEHPTQKPVNLMTWSIEQIGKPQSVLDPFMGSGTTGVACANLGRKFIGIEIERKYFDIACERIAAAYAQGRLFE